MHDAVRPLEAHVPDEDAVVREWWAFAHRIAQEFFLPGGDQNDVNQEALIGLLIGIRSYQPERGIPRKNWYGITTRRYLLTALKAAQRGKHGPLTDSVRGFVADDGDVLSIVDAIEGGSDPYDVLVSRGELAGLIERAKTLSPIERRAVMGIASGHTYAEIAADANPSMLDLAEFGVKWIDYAAQRARRKLAA